VNGSRLLSRSSTSRVTVFGPHPLLGVTIELRGKGDDVHLHPAGQGVWVARMAAELGAFPVLCSFLGGETGVLLAPLLDTLPVEIRSVHTSAASGCYVIDRRTGERKVIARSWSDPPSRHEADDLFSITCAAALRSRVLVVCGALPTDALPPEFYGNLVTDARANGVTVLVDLPSPHLDGALEGCPDLVKLDHWQLAEFIAGPVSEPVDLRRAAESVLDQGARAVLVTNGGQPAFVLRDEESWELVPPRFEGGAGEGSGDSMVGAIAAGLANDLCWEDALRLGAAGGATNFLRHGLGTGSRHVVHDLLDRVELHALQSR
jgi:1-phosphofructokinase